MPDHPTVPLICSTGSFWMWDLERTFGSIAEAGFDAIELMVTRDPRTQTPEVPARLARKEGLDIVALHAPMLVITRNVWGPNFRSIIDRSVAMAQALTADVVVVHPPYVWELRYQRWLTSELPRYTADTGVSVGVENMFRLWVAGRPVRGHRWVSPADLDRFSQITLDTSHCGVDGYDILEALDRLEGRTVHVHLSDNLGERRDSHALPGAGILPLEQFVRRLPAMGFQGALSLELDMREFTDDPKGAVKALEGARDFCLTNLS